MRNEALQCNISSSNQSRRHLGRDNLIDFALASMAERRFWTAPSRWRRRRENDGGMLADPPVMKAGRMKPISSDSQRVSEGRK